jgi:hypothetical protein
MTVYWGLADYFVDEVIELYGSRALAERALREILTDEPDWKGMLEVVPVGFLEFCPN